MPKKKLDLVHFLLYSSNQANMGNKLILKLFLKQSLNQNPVSLKEIKEKYGTVNFFFELKWQK